MSIPDPSYFRQLDARTLTHVLCEPNQHPDVYSQALAALKLHTPASRLQGLEEALKAIARAPAGYDDRTVTAVIDLLGTDPHPDATTAMAAALPDVLSGAASGGASLSTDLRGYYYSVLVTRSRETDLPVWSDVLPRLDGRTLAAALLDPAATPLEALEPMTLLGRLPGAERARALTWLVSGLAHRGAEPSRVENVARMIANIGDDELLERAAEALDSQWQQASRDGDSRTADLLEVALRIVDTRPRTAAERLRGRRPWAS